MAFFINNKILQQTTKCPLSFQCLDDEKRTICTVEWCLKDNGCFLETVKPNGCPYKVKFGATYMCKCPTRHELFTKHKI
jgi:hypothetical protein